ncbi:MFS transporter [Curtobacterium flaccumfaciens]|uniref:MFS transporter n=1 Tax=Curtobacterium flaccumfaciens TaxID=2035 RepID=UPI0013758213|nr:MFS transporter [Curtobacterium flaccumfaciens]
MLFTPARFRASLASLREHHFVTFAVLTDTIGAGLTLPLTIVYFTITTGVPLAVIGVLSTVASLVALPIGLVGGLLTDRFGAKASMILNNLLSARTGCGAWSSPTSSPASQRPSCSQRNAPATDPRRQQN